MSDKSGPNPEVGSVDPLLQYAVEDEFISKENPGIRDEINADLKTLEEIDIDQFLEEDDELNDKDDEGEEKEGDNDNSDGDSVDEDNFFLEDEEAPRKNKKARPNAGEVLLDCFNELGMQVKVRKEIKTAKQDSKQVIKSPVPNSDSLSDSTDGQNDTIESFSEEENENDDEEEGGETDKKNKLVCPYAPEACDYQANRKSNLTRHLKIMHTKMEAPEKCCGESFWTRAELNAHTRVQHGNIGPCPYPKCKGLRFARPDCFQRHLAAVHLDMKPFQCKFCPYRTSHKSNYERHIRSLHMANYFTEAGPDAAISLELKPFQCELCPYRSSHKSNYERHLQKLHRGHCLTDTDKEVAEEKPFQCELCPYRSSHKSNYEKHLREKHSIETVQQQPKERLKTYVCITCNYAYTVKSKFEAHMIKIHNQKHRDRLEIVNNK